MFNFHKPRTYRSTEGCCICRAKSSSSRFTDSRKYERDVVQCFDLKYPRQGEICNACVLLVKRFKRLPVGSKRNWSHVVDAKAGGPGANKLQTKFKSERISSRAVQQHQLDANNTNIHSGDIGGHINGNASTMASTTAVVNGCSFIPEKFTKIFKKSKKIKDNSSSSSASSSSTSSSSKRKSSNNGWSQNITQSLAITPDSLDSDYEDNTRLHANLTPGGTIVQFQTQTRASAYKAQAAAEARKRSIKLGTKRRKCLPPRKHRRSTVYEESIQFFDDEEWQEQKSCCGMLYECPALGGAVIIDVANYKPCELHQHRTTPAVAAANKSSCISESKTTLLPQLQKSIIQTMPAVVQLQPPQGPPPSVSLTHSNNNYNFKSTPTNTTTPVLKKHHLFFKRQSECFPQGDMVTNDSQSIAANAHVVNINKLESDFNMPPHHQYSSQQSTTLQRHIENAIHSSSNPTILTNPASSALSISVTTSSSAASHLPYTSASSLATMPQMPKHSLAKVTTISPTLTASHFNTTTAAANKSNSFLHKIKSDTGKIVKHGLEKFNTAVRLKTSDLHDMKPIIKTVDKSYILAKPPTHANINSLNVTNAAMAYQSLASYHHNATQAQPPLTTTTSLSAASPTSSTSSTSSTKFSDNSSDSGFDENMLDRKSASPLQEDCEKKLLSRPGVQTMFLASGVQIQGQPQNLVLTGNEVAAKILQNRKYSSIANSPVTSNPRSLTSNHPTTTAVKIAQISTTPLTATGGGGGGNGGLGVMSSAAQAKMRAIYNNNNTIQHENGITTIVPASSLAATSQISAMQNIAPSTVTITPAPPVGIPQFNPQNHIISRKLTTTTTANIINLQSNTNLSNSSNNSSSNGGGGGNHLNHLSSSNSSANQKIILLKTSSANGTSLSSSSLTTGTTSAGSMMTKYNTLQTTTLNAISGHCMSGGVSSGGGGGGGITR